MATLQIDQLTPKKHRNTKRPNSQGTPSKSQTNRGIVRQTPGTTSYTSGVATVAEGTSSTSCNSDTNVNKQTPVTTNSVMMDAATFVDQFKAAFLATMRDDEGKAVFINIIQPVVEDNMGKLAKIITQQQTKIDSLEKEIDVLMMKDRVKTLVITGIKEDKDKSPAEQVIQLCKEKLQFHIHPVDIDDIYRIKQRTPTKPPTIILTLTTKRKKVELMKVKKGLKNSTGEQIYINESLTPKKSELFARARSLVKEKKMFNAWTRDGHIYMKKNSADNPRLIQSIDELEKITHQ